MHWLLVLAKTIDIYNLYTSLKVTKHSKTLSKHHKTAYHLNTLHNTSSFLALYFGLL